VEPPVQLARRGAEAEPTNPRASRVGAGPDPRSLEVFVGDPGTLAESAARPREWPSNIPGTDAFITKPEPGNPTRSHAALRRNDDAGYTRLPEESLDGLPSDEVAQTQTPCRR